LFQGREEIKKELLVSAHYHLRASFFKEKRNRLNGVSGITCPFPLALKGIKGSKDWRQNLRKKIKKIVDKEKIL